MNIAFAGNAGHFDAMVDLAGSEGLAGPRVNYYIGHLSLNKDSSFADPLEWIAEFKIPRVVLLSNMSRTGGSSSSAVRRLRELTTFCCSGLNANKMT